MIRVRAGASAAIGTQRPPTFRSTRPLVVPVTMNESRGESTSRAPVAAASCGTPIRNGRPASAPRTSPVSRCVGASSTASIKSRLVADTRDVPSSTVVVSVTRPVASAAGV